MKHWSVAKIKDDGQKRLKKCYNLNEDLKQEKEQHRILKGHVNFRQAQQHELDKILRDKIDELSDKMQSLEERENQKEKHDL